MPLCEHVLSQTALTPSSGRRSRLNDPTHGKKERGSQPRASRGSCNKKTLPDRKEKIGAPTSSAKLAAQDEERCATRRPSHGHLPSDLARIRGASKVQEVRGHVLQHEV